MFDELLSRLRGLKSRVVPALSNLAPDNLAIKAATGETPAKLYEQAALGKSVVPYDSARPDRAVHALAAEKLTQRFGPQTARLAGIAKEGVQGLGQFVQGKPFVGVNGLDPQDLVANEKGIQRGTPNQMDLGAEVFRKLLGR